VSSGCEAQRLAACGPSGSPVDDDRPVRGNTDLHAGDVLTRQLSQDDRIDAVAKIGWGHGGADPRSGSRRVPRAAPGRNCASGYIRNPSDRPRAGGAQTPEEESSMLSEADNQRLTQVGPGTPMGNLFRRYWIPCLLSEELPERDGAPVRVRLLGEDLIAFRDSEGKVGLVSAFCPHRRAPMFFGRNEECGIRCVYHGWKFDRDGNCVDMPSEPPDSLFKTKVSIEAYATWEGGDMVWAYLGPKELQPSFPDHELVRAPATHRYVSKTFQDCNYLQALEGGIDPTHATIMHNMDIGDRSFLNNFDTLVAMMDIEVTDYGFTYAGIRQHQDFDWIRAYHWIMPTYHMRGQLGGLFSRPGQINSINGHIWIPQDDTHSWVFSFMYSADPAQPIPRDYGYDAETRMGRGANLYPDYKPKTNRNNDYLIDRHVQKTKTFTGIDGINTQDFALQEGMGPILDRTKEHVGSTDRAIILLRQILLESLKQMEAGQPTKAIDPASYRNVRAVDKLVPKDIPWKETCKEDYVARF
jgi:phthalate 4,5-dioxygenase